MDSDSAELIMGKPAVAIGCTARQLGHSDSRGLPGSAHPGWACPKIALWPKPLSLVDKRLVFSTPIEDDLVLIVGQDGILRTDCQSVLGSGAHARRADAIGPQDAILPHKADHYLRLLFFDNP